MQHKLKHLTFWSKHISSRTGPWHRWECCLVSASGKNWPRAWLSTFSPSAGKNRSLATKPGDEHFPFRPCLKAHIQGTVKNRRSCKTLASSSFEGYHKIRSQNLRYIDTCLYTNFSSTCSYRKCQRPFLRNALYFLLKQASERASYTLPTSFPPSLIIARTRFMFQPRPPLL